jgi:hypothetical protein
MLVTPFLPTVDSTTALSDPAAAYDAILQIPFIEDELRLPLNLSVMSNRELRVMCNQLYRALDEEFPLYGAQEDYAALRQELERRQADTP